MSAIKAMSISRNTAYNLLGMVAPILVALASIPIYIKLIGDQRYGVLSIAWILLGYFGVFDLGIGRAAAQRIAKLNKTDIVSKSQTFWTALFLNGGLGVVGGLILWPVAKYYFNQKFQIEESYRSEVMSALPWMMLALPLATVTGVLTGALQGVEKFLQLNVINASGSILFQTLPLLAAWLWTPNLAVLMPIAISVRMLGIIFLFLVCNKEVAGRRSPSFKKIEVRELLKFGGWITASSFISPIMVMADRFIIGAVLGSKAVTYYTVPFQLAERSTILPTALSSSLFPYFAKNNSKVNQKMGCDAVRKLILIMTPIFVAAILVSKLFLTLWISPELARHSNSVLQILLLGFWINGFARVPHAQLQASGRPDVVAICHIVEVIPFIFMLYLGIHFGGLVGAATAFSLRLYIDFLLLASQAGILKKNFALLSVGFFLLLAALSLSQQSYSNIVMVYASAILIAISMSWSVIYGLERLKNNIKNIFLRN